jgi:hypothetical protein
VSAHKKHRQSRKAVFIGVEDAAGGIGDLFIKYLKRRFGNRDVSVRHQACKGGSYADMLRIARQRMGNDAYDLRLLIWDSDRADTRLDQLPEAGGFKTVLLSPCIEGVLLNLLGKQSPKESRKCKSALMGIASFDHIEKMDRNLNGIDDACFQRHRDISRIIIAIQTGCMD